ncbi:MAG: GNAT family N-acetyltransferase [Eubacteriales bacterium]|nr:GNAT family N-acetyltransferase [Eubacteriales bacterium]
MIAPIDVTNIRIETPRLILRPWREDDLQDLFAYASVDGVGQMAGWMPHENLEKSKMILDMFIREKKVLALELKETGRVVGSLGIEEGDGRPEVPQELLGRELGYVLGRAWWGRGLMPEAVRAVMDHCFGVLHYDYLTCAHFVRNGQSRRVIEKCGFRYLKDILHETRYGTEEDTKLYIKFAPRRTALNGLEKRLEGVIMETDRLILRNFEDRDGDDCFVFLSDRESCYLDGGYEPFPEKNWEYWQLMEKMKGQKARFMLWHKADKRVIGTLNLQYRSDRAVETVELGYCVSPAYYRRGYATEAVKKAVSYLFEQTEVALVTAAAVAHNTASLAMLEKLGFTYEGTVHKGFRCPDVGVCDSKSYYLEK